MVAHETNDQPLVMGHQDEGTLTEQLLAPAIHGFRWFKPALIITGLGTLGLFTLILYTFLAGVGLWGNNIPVAWGFGIINFVWWIGIGHAGTFISAVLLVMSQHWRASINRFAEAMTLFAVMNAGLYPLLHLGRPWFFYWLIPYPSTMNMWPQFRSTLPWDVAAISTYGLVSLVFWYVGLIPDLATARDHAPGYWQKRIYGIFALGWRGSARHWVHYRLVYGSMAGIATALVVSVHSIVSMDFAIALLPGWHSTIFPPYFVAGAIFSGFAMVLTLMIPARRLFPLWNVITGRHLDLMAKMLLVTGLVVTGSYVIESFTAWYSGNPYERYMYLVDRPLGPYAWVYWVTIFCNCVVIQLLWFRRVRASEVVLFIVSVLVNVGMWAERFMLIVTSQHRDFLPSAWHLFIPSAVDWGIFFGTLCFFLFLFLLFLRLVPFIPIFEVKEVRHELSHHRGGH